MATPNDENTEMMNDGNNENAEMMNHIYETIFGPNHCDTDNDENPNNVDNVHANDENDEDVVYESESDEEHMENGDGGDLEEISESGPVPGMEFRSRESLKASLQAFAKSKGFSIISRNATTSRNSTDYKYMMLICSRGGKTGERKRTKKIDCPVRINAIKQPSGVWRVSKVSTLVHNHAVEAHMSTFMPAHRNLTIHMKRQLESNDIAGLRVSKSVRTLEVQAGGPLNLGASARDCRNFVNERRRLRLGEGDAEAVRTLFMRLQQKDRNFFHTMDIDDSGRLRNVP